MRFSIVSNRGDLLATYGSQEEAIAALRETLQAEPETLEQVAIVEFDSAGTATATMSADELRRLVSADGRDPVDPAVARGKPIAGAGTSKAAFVAAVAARSGLSKKDAGIALDAVLDSLKEALKNGDEVTFTGFGKFSVQARKARTGVNPRNPGQKVTIPASKVPKFSAGSGLKAAIKAGAG